MMNFKGKASLDDVLKEAAAAETFAGSDGTDNLVTNTISESDVPEFAGTKTVKQPDQPSKTASLTVLMKGMKASADAGTTVYPEKCPGVGRKENYGKDTKGEPACVFSSNNCPYFVDALFTLQDFNKTITCSLDEGN